MSIALEDPEGLALGVVFDPVRPELFAAVRGEGATLHGEPIRVSGRTELARAMVATGFSYESERRAGQADLLTSILAYHVVPDQLNSEQLVAAGTLPTVNGAELTVAMDGDTITVNDGAAMVACADIPTANATVYLIDSVLMPPA